MSEEGDDKNEIFDVGSLTAVDSDDVSMMAESNEGMVENKLVNTNVAASDRDGRGGTLSGGG